MSLFRVFFQCYILLLLYLNNEIVYGAFSFVALTKETDRLSKLAPFKYNDTYIMLWRPQKVGSSTLLSVFISHGFRYNSFPRAKLGRKSFCMKMLVCANSNPYLNASKIVKDMIAREVTRYSSQSGNIGSQIRIFGTPDRSMVARENVIESIQYFSSINHEMCYVDSSVIHQSLGCAFTSRRNRKKLDNSTQPKVKEVFILRDPLSRMISVYYFWGELAKMASLSRGSLISNDSDPNRTGKVMRMGNYAKQASGVIRSGLFTYHGNESTVPSLSIALAFANRFPLARGMPGPSFTWSGFSDNVDDAVRIVNTNRIMTVITERLEESLVVLAHYLGWSIADVVITLPRKALSSHPKHHQWPNDATSVLVKKLDESGEYEMYKAANKALDNRISDIKISGVDFDSELKLYKQIREHVTKVGYRRISATILHLQYHRTDRCA